MENFDNKIYTLDYVLSASAKMNGPFKPLKIAVVRNITLESIEPYLTYFIQSIGFKPTYYFSLYDDAIQQIHDSNSPLYQFKPDIIIMAIKLESLCPDLFNNFCALSDKKREQTQMFIQQYFEQLFSSLKKNTSAPVLFNNFETPTAPSFGIYDSQSLNHQQYTIKKLNILLVELIQTHSHIYLVDVDLLQHRIGSQHYYDLRYWYIGKAPYSKLAYPLLAKEYSKYCRALFGKNKKCLILDLDNTLWGGIIGEDGINKIQLGHAYPGSAFVDFQKAILTLYYRGVILAICSKNNLTDVMPVLNEHPDMVLRLKHFSVMKINWNNKVDNIREIAQEINIGLDSLVFIDDSDFEINFVKELLPEVTSIKLSKDPAQYAYFLMNFGLFDTLLYSEEDKNRTIMYRAEASRNQLKSSFDNIENYYRSLSIQVEIKRADEYSLSRISQLTQRSNQFNLTTQRYTESQLKEKMHSLQSDVFYLTVSDRFGKHGLVGVAIIDYHEGRKTAYINTFLLSCRVISYNVENVLLKTILDTCRSKGIQEVIGEYIQTDKNNLVKNFYTERYFQVESSADNRTVYKYDLRDNHNIVPNYFDLISTER